MTLTDAVNDCLAGIGLRPVARHDDPNLNAAMALRTINTASQALQSKGWWFNEEGGWFLAPDSNGEVRVPNNALDITTWNGSGDKALTIRDKKLYNLRTHSTDLRSIVNAAGTIELRMVMELPFEHLPSVAQIAIKDKAVRKYAQDVDGDVSKYKFNMSDEATSYALLCSAESTNTRRNAMQNPAVANLMSKMGGINASAFGGLQ